MKPSSPLLIRAASLSGLDGLARAYGLDTIALLHAFGLTLPMLASPDVRVPLTAVIGVLERASQLSGREDLGLRLAAERHISNLGATGMLMLLRPTLREALQGVIDRRQVLNDGLLMRLEEANGIAVLSFDLMSEQRHQGLRQSVELIAGVLVRLLRLFLDVDWMPRRVLLRHPPPLDMGLHVRVLGPCVEFGSAFNGLVMSSAELNQPIASCDPSMAEHVIRYALPRQHDGKMSDQVRQLLFTLLPSGQVSIDHVARHMGLHRRTLQRRLEEEGAVFKPILQSLRAELAQRYVSQSQRSLGDVAMLLGFSCPSAFSRWYRGHFGETAALIRRA